MKLKDISRTATFAWDQSSSSSPLLATGAIAGALDESFSNESQLEIWAPDFGEGQGMYLGAEGKGAQGSITVNSRFNRLAWSAPNTTHGRGVLAAGMETGEINVFDPEKIIAGAGADASRVFSNNKHTGPVRGLDFNPIQKNLLLSGAVNAELYIFDLNNPTNPIPPGNLSTKLGEITSLQWNPTVSRVFAASSSSGFTSVWDLKAQKEIVSLQYGGGAAKGMDTVGGVAGLQMGKRRGMSDVCWHPEQATRLITASEDDESPIIMLWDLRNTRAPERILSGHQKGVLSVSWCRQDADLLLSCGKDNRTLCWNPQTGEIIGELPSTSDWSFQTTWCPRNPDLLATASFDGHIGIHSLQTTQVTEQPVQQFSESATADDIFGALGSQGPTENNANVLSLKQPPKWLRRPVSATFGFGGLLASTSNLPGANGQHQSGVVHLRNIVTEQGIIDRARSLDSTAGDKEKLEGFCNGRAGEKTETAWKTLQTLFKANSKEELVQLLGFSKEDVASQVQEAIRKLPSIQVEDVEEPVTTPKAETPSEVSATSTGTKEPTEGTAQSSLFDEDVPGTPGGNSTDFFSSMAAGTLRNPQLDHIIPHKADVAESSVGATIGSRASSVRSEVIKDNTFHIYPSGESDVDRLITQALVLGDFSSAVELCLASERFADALLLAVRGGPELLQSTQKAYFARRTTSLPFLRVFQSIVTEDLADIVQNADLNEWKVIFVVLCTFAKPGEFNGLADQLGQRLQYKSHVQSGSDSADAQAGAKQAREDATLCYLASKRLDKVVGIWTDELREEEQSSSEPKYTAHAQALQSFIEKVSVFTAATGYVDEDLSIPTESAAVAEAGARTYKLAGLYDRYYEYADLLATQGLVDIAAKYVQQTPVDYKGTGAAGSELDKARDRLLRAADVSNAQASSSKVKQPVQARPAAPTAYAPAQPAYVAPTPAATGPYAPPTSAAPGPYAPPTPATTGPYAPPPSSYQSPPQQQQSYGYGAQNAYAQQSYQPAAPSPYAPAGNYAPEPQAQGYGGNSYGAPQQATLAPPPRAGTVNGANATPPPIPAAQRRDIPGWNDAPSFAAPPKRPQSAANKEAPKPIMSPFPMSQDPMASQGIQANIHGNTPPPPRSQQPGMLPPPPKGGPRPPSAQAIARGQMGAPAGPPPPVRPPPQAFGGQSPGSSAKGLPPRGGPPPGAMGGPPPRALSPLGPQGRTTPLTASLQAGPPPNFQAGPPPSQFQAGPPPSQFQAGPPPPRQQSFQGGPPPPPAGYTSRPTSAATGQPPNRRASVTQSIPPVTSPSSAPAPLPPAPSKPTHPAGDREHIPDTSRPIYDTLRAELARVKQLNLPPAIGRIVENTDQRLNILFDQLNNDSIPKPVLDQLSQVSKAIASRDSQSALAQHVSLSTAATGEMSAWAPGIKQLIRLGA